MKVKDIMSWNIERISPDATLQQAADKMRHLNVNSLPVCQGPTVVGILTDRDITVRSVAEGHDPTRTQVEAIMTRGAISCFEDDDVEEAARLMQDRGVHHLIVLTRDQQRLIGMVSLKDLASRVDERAAGKVLSAETEPTKEIIRPRY